MERLSDKARLYARSYGQPPYGRKIEGTAKLLLQMADKLEEYEDLEEQGKLLKLPCAVGDVVYKVSPNHVYVDTCQITGFAECDSIKSMCYTVYIDPDEEDIIALSDFGKTVFLTREEAALKEL